MWSLTQTLERLMPHLPESVAPRDARARVAAAAERLPAPLTSCLYLERFLRQEPPRLDLILRVDAGARTLLAASASWPGAVGEEWTRLASFARDWADPSRPLGVAVEALWLEFDLPATPLPAPTVPRVFVDFTREARQLPADERCALAVAILGSLAPEPPTPDLRRALRACLGALPGGAFVPYVGLSLARSGGARVCVQGLGRELLPYLRRVGWPGDADGLAGDVLAPLAGAKGVAPDEAVHVLHLDLDPDVRPRIGLEYVFARAGQARGALREIRFLDLLVERGWCDAALRDGLLAWPGRQEEMLAHQIWPSRVERRVNHVKVTHAAGGPVEAKAYLAALVAPRGDATLVGGRHGLPLDEERAGARQPGAIE